MFKVTAMASSVLVSLGLAALAPPTQRGREEPRPKGKEAAEKKEHGPAGDLTKAYDLLRRLRADAASNDRPEERIRDWTERAASYYRDGLKAFEARDEFLAHEYGAVAHDLARSADHAQKAALFDRRDPELPTPPEGAGPDDSGERARHDLNRAYDRIMELGDREVVPAAEVFFKASRDLYTAARHDVEAGRVERGGELARAAEAMTHVVDHLGHAADGPPEERDRPKEKAKAKRGGRPEPKEKGGRFDWPDADLPPPLPPE